MEFLPGCEMFLTGCNYWSSESGIRMWRNWSAGAVEKDFIALKECGVNTLRVFPLWQDFQPVSWACGIAGEHKELVMPSGKALPEKGVEHYGLDPVMLERFRTLADLAQKYEIKLIVALLTGWMSGALFVPPALADKNLFNHPEALHLETLFLRGFVDAMKDHPAIIVWEPGNECNCLSPAVDVATSWNWLNMVVSTIKLCDPSRPVYSGMHGTVNDHALPWNQRVIGELTDAATTHPYPAFTPFCGKSALNTIPAIYHASAETLYYRGGTARPAFIEEIGSFGPGYLDPERTEAYFYTVLFSAYALGIPGALWWCAFAFDKCNEQYPYRWIAMERDLGALDSERLPGGAARAMKKFQSEISALPFEKLPPRQVDCLVVSTWNDQMWRSAYGAFILSTQAGFNIEFCDIISRDILPEANFYIVPSISGFSVMPIDKYRQLLAAAENGATVCFTAGSGMLQPFCNEFGCEVAFCAEKSSTVSFKLPGSETLFTINSPITRRLKAIDCEVIAADLSGDPVLICKKYGKGKLVYLNAPVENAAITDETQLYHIYRKIAALAGVECPEKSPEIGISRHHFSDGRELRIFINYADHPADGMAGNSVKMEYV